MVALANGKNGIADRAPLPPPVYRGMCTPFVTDGFQGRGFGSR